MPFSAVHGLEHDEIASAIFNARVIEAGLSAVCSDNWATSAKSVELEGRRTFTHLTRWGQREVIDVSGAAWTCGSWPGRRLSQSRRTARGPLVPSSNAFASSCPRPTRRVPRR